MGKITNALKKAAEERLQKYDRISRIRERDKIVARKMGDSKIDSRIIAYFDPKSPVTEQYKILRTNLLSSQKAKAVKVIAITSSVHSEGKTLTALNLAITLANDSHQPKVLLIDADLRRGKVLRYLGIPQMNGLTELLTGEAELDDVMFGIDVENLTIIAAGAVPQHPAELLGSQKMKTYLAQLKNQFDIILIDTPPLISVTDPGVIGARTDGVVLVIQAGRTQRGIVKRATEILHQAQGKLLGYVLTNIEYHLPEYLYRYL